MMLRVDTAAARHGLPLWDEAALRAAEAEAARRLAPHTLMQRAGEAAARLLRANWPHARRVLVLCGPGNNGGDGLAAAAWLARQPHAPQLELLLPGCGDAAQWNPATRPADWCWALAEARGAGLQPRAWAEVDAARLLQDSDVVLDAMLGLGSRQAPRGDIAEAIDLLCALPRRPPVLAVDVPSGLSCASGEAPGSLLAADVTLAMLGLRAGHVGGPHSTACGRLWLDDLQAAPGGVGQRASACWGDTAAALAAVAPPEAAAHKGARGDVRIFGGAAGMGGALWLAARAALGLGAGRVFAAALDPAAGALDPVYPEVMLRQPPDLLQQARAARGTRACLVFGPGAGTGATAWQLLCELLPLEQPLVIDADGLNLLAAQAPDAQAWRWLRARAAPTWLTPHPAEAARLLRCDVAAIQADRIGAARSLCAQSGAHVVLKGAGSVIACCDGALWINPSGNGLLASAGSGDVLSGALAALLARSDGGRDAARAAVWLHGAAADLALREALPLRAAELPELMLRAWRAARDGIRQPGP